jgi:DNA-binding SARP family transcriptional activator/tetratricopeptide (TPR) repeat protein
MMEMSEPARKPDRAVEFRLLGDVEAIVDGRVVDLGHARQRCVLTVLLIDNGRVIASEQLLSRAWARHPPRRGLATLSGYLSRLRRLLTQGSGISLEWRSGGYILTTDPMTIDIHRFRYLVNQASTADDSTALELLDKALALWRGEPFATLTTPWLDSVRESLTAERHDAELDRNDLALAAGRHRTLLRELVDRAAAHPLDERLAGQLMLALYRCGRQADALQRYEQLRLRLANELGADPSPPLQVLHKQILTTDPVLSWSDRSTPSPVPRELPARPRTFTGRTRELNQLNVILANLGEAHTAGTIVALSGMAGIGKTTLAVYWAHQVAPRFPDGHLFVNLRGYDPSGQPMRPEEAIRRFLDALNVPTDRIPSNVDSQLALYRSMLAERRMLIVLDNARDTEQVRPLLPGAPGSLVVVTSRQQLTGLVANEGAHPLVLDAFGADEARDLLGRHVGTDRIAGEPEAVSQIITRCAQLPLALSAVAARAALNPTFALAAIARELNDTRHSLDALAGPDAATDVRVVFSWSYHALDDAAARLFRLLGLHPGPDLSAPAAASLAGLSRARARSLLAELAHAHLVVEHQPGRYAMHDLIRAYAAEQAHDHESEPDQQHAIGRMLDHYLHCAYVANRLINPSRANAPAPAPARAGVTPEEFEDANGAEVWFAAEHHVLLAVHNRAAKSRFDPHTWQLPWVCATFLLRRGYVHDLVAMHKSALDASRRLADPTAQGFAHRTLANAFVRMGQYDDAHEHLRQALDISTAARDEPAVALTELLIGWMLGEQGRYDEALPYDRRAVESFRTVGDQGGQALALTDVGWHLAQLGEYAQALPIIQESLDLHAGTGDRHGLAAALHSLGFIQHRLGQYEHAIASYLSGVELCRQERYRFLEAEILADLGDTYESVGNPDAARQAWKSALDILEDLDHPYADTVRAKLSTSRTAPTHT